MSTLKVLAVWMISDVLLFFAGLALVGDKSPIMDMLVFDMSVVLALVITWVLQPIVYEGKLGIFQARERFKKLTNPKGKYQI